MAVGRSGTLPPVRRPSPGCGTTSAPTTPSSTRTTSRITTPDERWRSGRPPVDGQPHHPQVAVLVGHRDDPAHPVEALVLGVVAGVEQRNEGESLELDRDGELGRAPVWTFDELALLHFQIGIVVDVDEWFGDGLGEGPRLDLGAPRLQGR